MADTEHMEALQEKARRVYTWIRAAHALMSPGNLMGVRDTLYDFRYFVQSDPAVFSPGPMTALCMWIEEEDNSPAERESQISKLLEQVRKMLEGEYGFR